MLSVLATARIRKERTMKIVQLPPTISWRQFHAMLDAPGVLTIGQAARWLRTSPGRVRLLIQEGKLTFAEPHPSPAFPDYEAEDLRERFVNTADVIGLGGLPPQR